MHIMKKSINNKFILIQELKTGGHFQELDEAVKELSKYLVKVKTQKDLKIDSMKEEEKSLESLDSNAKDVSSYEIS